MLTVLVLLVLALAAWLFLAVPLALLVGGLIRRGAGSQEPLPARHRAGAHATRPRTLVAR